MNRMFRIFLVVFAVAALAIPIAAQQATPQNSPNPLVQLLQSKGILSADEAATVRSAENTAQANERLARLLWSKGLISQQEYNATVAAAAMSAANTSPSGAHMVNAAAAPTAAEPAAAVEPAAAPAGRASPRSNEFNYASINSLGYDPLDGASADAGVIPAIAPVRVLPITLPKDPKGIIPDIKLGGGAMINPYGFFKASAVYDTTNSGGATFGNIDFPLPLMINGDTGPSSDQFRIKARSARFGANVYYPLNGPDITLTGKIEFDWEGDYETADNRNISSQRSNQASLRLAWARLDAKWGTTPVYLEFGQDWTLLGSSTVMDLFETTGFGVFFGNYYERIPQIKVGTQFKAGSVTVVPEFALVLPDFGDANLNNSTTIAVLGATGVVPTGFTNQSREGNDDLGPDSGQPGVQGRIVIDFPLNKEWKGVANAELIVAGSHETGTEIVPFGNIPTTPFTDAALPTGVTSFECANGPEAGTVAADLRSCYPHGFTMNIPQNQFDAEFQLPTPWITLVGKLYKGGDMRFMFAGQANGAFTDTMGEETLAAPPVAVLCVPGSTGCTTYPIGSSNICAGTSCDNIAQAVYALNGDTMTFIRTAPVGGVSMIRFAPYRPVRGYGGLIQAGFPLSRIFGANPEGLNRGWTLYAAYGFDGALNRDTVRLGANGLRRSDYVPVSLRYQVNKWMQFVNEVTWYDTRVGSCTALTPSTECENGLGAPLSGYFVNGYPSRINHDIREEFGTVLTF